MIAGESRLSRWQDHSAKDALRGSASAPLREQTQAALEAVMHASRSARSRLERWRSSHANRVGLVAAVGAAGIASLFGLLVVPVFERETALPLACAAALAAAGAGFALAREAWPRRRASHDLSASIAGDAAWAAQAKQLADLALLIDEHPSTSAETLLARLVAEVERAADLSRRRESQGRGTKESRGRRYSRVVPRQTRTVLTTPDNKTLHARIVDVSRSGVAVDGNFPGCAVGAWVRIGSHKARVVRVLPRGLGCEFADLLPAALLTADIVL